MTFVRNAKGLRVPIAFHGGESDDRRFESVADARLTLTMLLLTSLVRSAACCRLPEISRVAAPC